MHKDKKRYFKVIISCLLSITLILPGLPLKVLTAKADGFTETGAVSAPGVESQTIVFDRDNKQDLTYPVNLGSGSLAATGVIKLAINGVYMPYGNWTYKNGYVTIDKGCLIWKDNGTYTITTVFNDIASTNDKSVILEVKGSDDEPDFIPQSLIYDKHYAAPIHIALYYGSGTRKASTVSKIWIDDKEATDWNISSNLLTVGISAFADKKTDSIVKLTVSFDTGVFRYVEFTVTDSTPEDSEPGTELENQIPGFKTSPVKIVSGSSIAADIEIFPGKGSFRVEGIREVVLDNIVLSKDLWSYQGNHLLISGEYIKRLAEGLHYIEITFDDDWKTYIAGYMIEIVDTSPGGGDTNGSSIWNQTIYYYGENIKYYIAKTADRLTGVAMNGEQLPEGTWTVAGDELIISNDYLRALSSGVFAVTLAYNDGTELQDKLFLVMPKDTSGINITTSALNVLYAMGSQTDIKIPLDRSISSVVEFSIDSSFAGNDDWNFDPETKILTINHELLEEDSPEIHSIIITVKYESKAMLKQVGRSFVGILEVTGSDIGIVIATANSGTTGLTYHASAENEIVIDGYIGTSTEVVIPSQIKGLAVTKIESLGEYSNTITKITVPDTVVKISSNVIDSHTDIISGTGSAAESYALMNGNRFSSSGIKEESNSGEYRWNLQESSSGTSITYPEKPLDINIKAGSKKDISIPLKLTLAPSATREIIIGDNVLNEKEFAVKADSLVIKGSYISKLVVGKYEVRVNILSENHAIIKSGLVASVTVEPVSKTVMIDKTVTMKTGSQIKITPVTGSAIKYTVSDKKVLKLGKGGVVNAKNTGTAYVYMRTEGENIYKIKIVVTKSSKLKETVYSNKTMKAGTYFNIYPQFQNTVFSLTKHGIINVNLAGKVKAIATGTTSVTVKAVYNGIQIRHTIKVTVK